MMSKIKQWIQNFLKSFKLSGLPAILGLLGAYGGQENKWVRRIGIPIIFTICALIELRSVWVLLLMSIAGWLSCGYGLPDSFEGGDKGSFLGRLWFNVLNVWQNLNRRIYADILTRGTIGLGVALSFLVVPLLKGNWSIYSLASVGIILIWSLVSWQGFGSFKVKLFGKELECLKVDFVTYSLTAFLSFLIIYR